MKVLSARNHSLKQQNNHNSQEKQCIKLGARKTQSNQKTKQNTDTSHQSSHIEQLKEIAKMLRPKPIHTTNRNAKFDPQNAPVRIRPQMAIDVHRQESARNQPISPINSITKIIRAESIEGKNAELAKNEEREKQTPNRGNINHHRKLKLYMTNKSPLKINLQ